jgi:hypothetical protein
MDEKIASFVVIAFYAFAAIRFHFAIKLPGSHHAPTAKTGLHERQEQFSPT